MSSGTAWRSRHACLILTVFMLALAVVACDGDDSRVSGSGAIVTESRQVEGFDEIVVSEFGRVEVCLLYTSPSPRDLNPNLVFRLKL